MMIYFSEMDGTGQLTKSECRQVHSGATYRQMKELLQAIAQTLFGDNWVMKDNPDYLIPFYVAGRGERERCSLTIE